MSEIPNSVKAVGRAGTGVNNIPVEAMSERGVPVFNAPGANANAVKELVFACILAASRNVVPAAAYVSALEGGYAPERLGVAGVRDVHDLHVWTVTSGVVAMSVTGLFGRARHEI